MDIIIFILLILLLNAILGCLAIYYENEKITLYDLILSIISGVVIFLIIMPIYLVDLIEDKTYHIILFKKRNK